MLMPYMLDSLWLFVPGSLYEPAWPMPSIVLLYVFLKVYLLWTYIEVIPGERPPTPEGSPGDVEGRIK